MDNYYGFESTNEVQYDKAGLPVGLYKAMATGEEAAEKDGNITGVVVTWEVLDGDHKGKQGKVWYNTMHHHVQTSNIAKQSLKRLAEASGSPITPTSPIKGRVVTLEVRQQKKNPDYTEVFKYHPENYSPVDDEIPFA